MPEQFTHRAICQLHERGQVIRDHFVSQLLSSNPLGDPAERDLLVYLPSGYERSPNRFCQNSDDVLEWRPLMEYACEKHTSHEE